jgi:hypothetical protein
MFRVKSALSVPLTGHSPSGDILLCYLTGVSRFIGALEVIGEPFVDKSPIWRSDVFPARLPVKVLIQLKAETAIPPKAARPR